MNDHLYYATRLLLIAANTALTTKFLGHACCHVTLTGCPALINAHPFAGFLVNIRGAQAALNHPTCWPCCTAPAFLFFTANTCLWPAQPISGPKTAMRRTFTRPLIGSAGCRYRRCRCHPQERRYHHQVQNHIIFHQTLPILASTTGTTRVPFVILRQTDKYLKCRVVG